MKLSIYKKMMIGYIVIITIMIVSSAYVLIELDTVTNVAKNILTTNVKTHELAKQLQVVIQDENGYAEKYMVSSDEIYFSLFVETSRQVDQHLNALNDRLSFHEDRLLMPVMKKAHQALVEGFKQYAGEPLDPDTHPDYFRQGNLGVLLNSLDQLISRNQSSVGQSISRIETITNRSVQVALLLIAGTLFVAVTAALIITRTITRPISDLIKGTKQIAQGNFEKIFVSSNDEIGLLADAVNNMSSKIDEVNGLRTHMMQQISHELKTPLQAMQSAHDVLRISKSLNESQLRMLDAIKRGIEKIENFSMQYLDLAKIESGAMKYNLQLSNLHKIVAPVVEEAKLVAASKNINIQLDFIADPMVYVDTEKVSIIVRNLIRNAIKYTQKNGSIVVSISPCDLGVQVEVQDSGIGIKHPGGGMPLNGESRK